MKASTAPPLHVKLAVPALALAAALLQAPVALALEAADDATLQYEVRPGDDPSRLARMFRVPVEELLRRNGIRDASRLRVGTVLEIPDPRATLVQELRSEQDALRSTVEELRAGLDGQRARVSSLEEELARTAAERDALEGRLAMYGVTKVVAGVALLAGLGLAGVLALTLAALRDEKRRRLATVKHSEALRAAVERYRNLGGQLELKYHNLYRQPSDVSTEAAAKMLRAAYDEERAALEARIAESEAALGDLDKPARGRRKHHKAA